MILFKFKEHPETRPKFPCTAFRWTIQTNWFKGGGFQIGFVHQSQSNGEWCDSHTSVYALSLHRPASFGIEHYYYDGPHCSLSLGWLHVLWGGGIRSGWCKKCMPD